MVMNAIKMWAGLYIVIWFRAASVSPFQHRLETRKYTKKMNIKSLQAKEPYLSLYLYTLLSMSSICSLPMEANSRGPPAIAW